MTDAGTYRCYVAKDFSDEHLSLIGVASGIIEQYEAKGYSLTLRQLFYQFVARGLLPSKQSEYSRLGGVVSDARLAGLVSWTALEDRTRNLRGLRTYDRPDEAVREARDAYRLDRWANQLMRPEVWIEKDALLGIVAPVCDELGIDYFSCRGYNSQSEQWRAGRRFAAYVTRGQRPIVFHLGDHDPSGIDMTRDNRDRLSMFAGIDVQVVRLALNWAQIEELKPPHNPTKLTDSRARGYIDKYGESCWELDALDPDYAGELIRKSVLAMRDEAKYSEMLAEEADDRDTLDLILKNMQLE